MFQTGAAELAPVNQSVPLTAFTLTADLVFQGKKKKKKESAQGKQISFTHPKRQTWNQCVEWLLSYKQEAVCCKRECKETQRCQNTREE